MGELKSVMRWTGLGLRWMASSRFILSHSTGDAPPPAAAARPAMLKESPALVCEVELWALLPARRAEKSNPPEGAGGGFTLTL